MINVFFKLILTRKTTWRAQTSTEAKQSYRSVVLLQFLFSIRLWLVFVLSIPKLNFYHMFILLNIFRLKKKKEKNTHVVGANWRVTHELKNQLGLALWWSPSYKMTQLSPLYVNSVWSYGQKNKLFDFQWPSSLTFAHQKLMLFQTLEEQKCQNKNETKQKKVHTNCIFMYVYTLTFFHTFLLNVSGEY